MQKNLRPHPRTTESACLSARFSATAYAHWKFEKHSLGHPSLTEGFGFISYTHHQLSVNHLLILCVSQEPSMSLGAYGPKQDLSNYGNIIKINSNSRSSLLYHQTYLKFFWQIYYDYILSYKQWMLIFLESSYLLYRDRRE